MALIALVGVGACAQTVNAIDDVVPVSDAAVEAGGGDASTVDQSSACTRSDWRCADLIDPADRIVWVDQDVSLPGVVGDYWRSNRLRYGVRLSPYRMGRYEVTNEAYAACSRAGTCPPPPMQILNVQPRELPFDYSTAAAYRHHPVMVNWHRARAVCRFLGGDIPTKAQWQFAANGGGPRRFPWGDEMRCLGIFSRIHIVADSPGPELERLDCPANTHYPRVLEVDAASDARGPFGTYNLLGNVSEMMYSDLDYDWSMVIRRRNDAGEFPLDPTPVAEPYSGLRSGGDWGDIFQITFASRPVSVAADAPVSPVGVRCVWPGR